MIKKLKCPHCGNTNIFICRAYVRGVVDTKISFKDHDVDNSGMYDGLSYDYNKYIICNECGEKAFTYKDCLRSKALKDFIIRR